MIRYNHQRKEREEQTVNRREELMDKAIRTWGFENDWVIWFCQVCEDERMTAQMIELAFNEVIAHAMDTEDEEEL